MPYTLHPDHFLPNKKDRVKKAKNCGERYLANMFNRVDDLLDAAYCDYANGLSRADIIEKLTQGLYDVQDGKKMPYRSANVYFNGVLERMAVNTDMELKEMKNVFYTRYEALYEEAVKRGDISGARQVLTDMAKIFGVQQQTPQTAVQINSESDGQIQINFGFQAENDDDE